MSLATAVSDRELIDAVIAEMAAGIECALEFWMAQIESALEDPRLTTLGRLNAIQQILKNYRQPAVHAAVFPGGYAA